MVKDAFYGIDQLKKDYGLKTNAIWFEAFNDAPEKKVRYIRRMRENGEKLTKAPRITLSTIHGVKGGEQDNVILLTDLSRNTQKNYEKILTMKIDYSMLVQLELKIIYTSSDQKTFTKDIEYENRRRVKVSTRTSYRT